MRRTLILTTLALAPLALNASCTPHARYPDIDGDVATTDLNILPSPIVMRLALKRVGERHLDGARPYAIDFPPNVDEELARDIAAKMGEHVSVAWDAPAGAPVIKVVRVWVLGDQAQVDVQRPVADLGTQLLTVRLRSDIRGWRIDGLRSWPVGLRPEDIPPLQRPNPDANPDPDPDADADPELEYEQVPAEETPTDDADEADTSA